MLQQITVKKKKNKKKKGKKRMRNVFAQS